MVGEQLFGIAWEALRANKVRAALTMLGIIIGVLAVIVMIGIGQASQAYITQQVKGLGANMLVITPGSPKTPGFGPPGTFAQSLTYDDATALESTLPGIEFVSANAFLRATFKVRRRQWSGLVFGAGANFPQARGLKVSRGRFFNEQEVRQGAKVIILGTKLVAELYDKSPEVEPFTDKVLIENQRYRVIGILEKQGSGLMGSTDDAAVMPITAFQQSLRSGKRVNSIFLRLVSEERVAATLRAATDLLRRRHKIRSDEDDDFKVQTQADVLATVTTVTQVFTFLLAAIAGISLLVGGIGIMNIMLVSVTERTREIGIRKAVGAKRRDILAQFLIESGTLSLVGGTVGMLLGTLITYGATRAIQLPFIFSPTAVIGAFLFSAAVGVFFGLYPASRAARLDPVEALRFE